MRGTIIFATGNAGKMREIRSILSDMGREILSMKEAGVQAEIREDGSTYEENALIKARAVAAGIRDTFPRAIVLADDSGLEVDHLNREPGIHSARYLGEETSYRVKNASILERLEGVPEEERTARFVCAIAAVLPDGSERTVRAAIEGYIGQEEMGSGGFGYDPIFYVPEFGRTTAELTEAEKNQISHRGKALRLMKEELRRYDLPREEEFCIGRYRVWLTHGHNYYVAMGTDTIKREAAARRMDIVMFGHTHRPLIDTEGEVIAINPGSLSYPRQEGRRPSYILMEMDPQEELHFSLRYL